MTAAIPPSRSHLAAMLRVLAGSPAHFGLDARRDLLAYLTIAEDTIEAQAAMLRADLTELGAQVKHNGALTADVERLHTENTSLRQLVEAALNLAQLDDRAAAQPHLDTIRTALERTS